MDWYDYEPTRNWVAVLGHAREVLPPGPAEVFEKLTSRLLQGPISVEEAKAAYGRSSVEFMIAADILRSVIPKDLRQRLRGGIKRNLELTGHLPAVPISWNVRKRGNGLVPKRMKRSRDKLSELRAENSQLRRQLLDLERQLSELRA